MPFSVAGLDSLKRIRCAAVARLLTILILPVSFAGCSLLPLQEPEDSVSVVSPAAKPIAAKRGSRFITRFESFSDRVFFDPAFKQIPLPVEPELSPATAQAAAPGIDALELKNLVSIRREDNILHCKRIDQRLNSVSFRSCLSLEHQDSNFRSSMGEPIYHIDFEGISGQKSLGKVLVLGGVHGDELTSVSTVYLWLQTLREFHSGLFEWRVVPLVNPDGFFSRHPRRTNANGIDLNRNLPTYQWQQLASRYWQKYASATARKFPGYAPASEPESQWLVNEINSYKPDVIITVHAPYNLVDYDAADRANAPQRLGILQGKSLGTFPGSLGRFAGEERNIPVITLELPHSTRMPGGEAIDGIWFDLVSWLRQNINTHNIAGRTFSHCSRSARAVGCI